MITLNGLMADVARGVISSFCVPCKLNHVVGNISNRVDVGVGRFQFLFHTSRTIRNNHPQSA